MLFKKKLEKLLALVVGFTYNIEGSAVDFEKFPPSELARWKHRELLEDEKMIFFYERDYL